MEPLSLSVETIRSPHPGQSIVGISIRLRLRFLLMVISHSSRVILRSYLINYSKTDECSSRRAGRTFPRSRLADISKSRHVSQMVTFTGTSLTDNSVPQGMTGAKLVCYGWFWPYYEDCLRRSRKYPLIILTFIRKLPVPQILLPDRKIKFAQRSEGMALRKWHVIFLPGGRRLVQPG
jgi:hypothetical protein